MKSFVFRMTHNYGLYTAIVIANNSEEAIGLVKNSKENVLDEEEWNEIDNNEDGDYFVCWDIDELPLIPTVDTPQILYFDGAEG